MGFAAVAGHVIILVAAFSAGILLAGAINNSLSSQIDARNDLTDRLTDAARTDYALASEGYSAGTDRTYANFTNDGAREIHLDHVTLLIDGIHHAHDDIAHVEIRETSTSEIWMPGETLEIMTENQGNTNITVADLYGLATHRRA